MKTSEVTYAPLTMAVFEEAIAKAEEERGSPRPVTAFVANGNRHDFHWMDKNYVIGCDPYKECDEGSVAIYEKPSVLTQEQFEAEVKRVAGFYGENLTDEK